MHFRKAAIEDIPQMHAVRMAVKENRLSNPLLVTETAYIPYLTMLGKGWVCETKDNGIVGFGIIDTDKHNIWALFIQPGFEEKGIGSKLHTLMLNWYFRTHRTNLWLSTAFNTRAAVFYRTKGWKESGKHSETEIKFEMSFEDWKRKNNYPYLK